MDEKQKKLLQDLLSSDAKGAGFVKRLFFAHFDSGAISPYPSGDDPDTECFISNLQDFIEKEIDAAAIDRAAKIPDSVVAGLSRLGVMAMTVPKEYGGLGMSQRAYCKATETLAKTCASTALFVNVHQSIGLKGLVLFGTEEQKQKWLPQMASGQAIGAFSLTEPCAGSDAAAIQCLAEYDPEKKVYRLNGVKQWSTNASFAKVLTVMARTDDGITAFLVNPDMKGFEVTHPALEKVGMRGTWTANLKFTDMEVPEENILGQKGKGLKVALSVLDYGRTTFGAMCTGIAKDLLQRSIAHATDRKQFRAPLASFGMVKKKLARMAALVFAMDAAVYLTADLIDKGTEDIMLESAILKVFASDALWEIIYETMQIFGGRSFFTDAPFERNMRDARLNQIGEGSNEVMRAFIAVVGLRDVGLLFKGLWDSGSYAELGKRLFAFAALPSGPRGSDEARQFCRSLRRFGRSCFHLLVRNGEKVVDAQLELERIANGAISLYTTAAVLSKLEIDQTNKDAAYHYCRMALASLNKNLDALFSPEDEKIYALSQRLVQEGF